MSESAELREILALTREFALAELRPRSEAWERAGALGDDTMAQLAELGFLAMTAPESAGGMGLDRASMLAAVTRLAWGEASAGLAVAQHGQVISMLVRAAPDSVRQRWLGPLAAGELIGCASAVPSESAVRAAESPGGGWVLDGVVPWVANARERGLLAVPAEAAAGPLLALVPVTADGVSRRSLPATLGLRPLALAAVALHDVAVAPEAVVSGPPVPAETWALQAEESALGVAAVAVGIGQAALEHARDYAEAREQFGRRLREFEAIGHKLADMTIRVAGARALLELAAAEPAPGLASAAKVAAAEAAMEVTTQAVQVFGGYGYMREYPVEKLMRDARAMSLLGGTDDAHRARIVEQLYQQ